MKEFFNDPFFYGGVFYLYLIVAIVLLFPKSFIKDYFNLTKERQFTRWGAIVHLADNMKSETDSPLSYYFFDFLTIIIVILLIILLFH